MNRVRRGIKYVCSRFDGWSAEWFFLVLSAVISLVFVFMIPPFYMPDERTHLMKIVDMSYGHISAQKASASKVGAYLPAKYQLTADHYVYMIPHPSMRPPLREVERDLAHPLTSNEPLLTPFENTAVYPPLAYLPQTLVVFFARLLGASVVVQMYAARIASLVCWLAIVFFAIRILPFGKWGAVGLSLLPISYLLAASSSNDAITFGLCLLFIAVLLRIAISDKPRGRRYLLFCAILALALGLCKQPYMLLTLLVFIVPRRFFRSQKEYWLYCLGCISGSFILSGIWSLTVQKIYIPTSPSANTGLQLHYILGHPIQAFHIITASMFLNSMADFVFGDFTGLAHWVAIRIPESFKIANDVLVALLLIIASPFEKVNKLKIWMRRSMVMLGLVGSYAIALLIYLSFEAVRARQLTGLNSRYFIPFIYLAIPIFSDLQLKSVGQYVSFLRYSKLALMAVGAMCVTATTVRFY